MTKLKQWLSGLLAVQVALTFVLYFNANSEAEFDAQQRLINISSANINKLVIADQEGSSVIQKQGDQWMLPEYQELPVKTAKVEGILEKLEGVKSGWPIASSSASHNRFEVSNDNFQRKVQLYSGEKKIAEVLMGSSPGYRSIHTRLADDNNIFSVKLASYDFAAKNVDWLDKALLQVSNIKHVKGADFEVDKQDDNWQMLSKPMVVDDKTTELDTAKMEELASFFENLRIQEPQLEALPTDIDKPQNKPVEITLTQDGTGTTWTYRFIADNDNYFVKRNDREIMFKISQNDYKKITQVNLDYLVMHKEDGEDAVEAKNEDLSIVQ